MDKDCQLLRLISHRLSLKSGNARNSPLRFHRMTGWRKVDPVRVAAQSRVAGWFRMTTVSSGSLVNSKVGNDGVETSIEPEIADAGF